MLSNIHTGVVHIVSDVLGCRPEALPMDTTLESMKTDNIDLGEISMRLEEDFTEQISEYDTDAMTPLEIIDTITSLEHPWIP